MIIRQKFIHRVDMIANPHLLYIWGDNEMRQGKGGQAKEMRGESNGIGIRTKRKPLFDPDAYWTDEDYDRQVKMLNGDFLEVINAMPQYNGLVIPLDGIGTGMAELSTRAPDTLKALNTWINYLVETYK